MRGYRRRARKQQGSDNNEDPGRLVIRPVFTTEPTASPFRPAQPLLPIAQASENSGYIYVAESVAHTTPQDVPQNNSKKRDSVMSNTSDVLVWQPSKPATRRSWPFRFRAKRWLPCRAYIWCRDLSTALYRTCSGDRRMDVFLSVCLLATTMIAAYIASEFILLVFKPVAAQDLTPDANCSIVYVTVPGPIITVSLIGATPSNPARATYYFSVINGSTQWLDSVAPPSRSYTLPTRTIDSTPNISSLSPGASIIVSTRSLTGQSPTPGLPSDPTFSPDQSSLLSGPSTPSSIPVSSRNLTPTDQPARPSPSPL